MTADWRTGSFSFQLLFLPSHSPQISNKAWKNVPRASSVLLEDLHYTLELIIPKVEFSKVEFRGDWLMCMRVWSGGKWGVRLDVDNCSLHSSLESMNYFLHIKQPQSRPYLYRENFKPDTCIGEAYNGPLQLSKCPFYSGSLCKGKTWFKMKCRHSKRL